MVAGTRLLFCLLLPGAVLTAGGAAESEGVFVRFRLLAPAARYYVKLGGYIHQEPWYLPKAVLPAGADKKDGPRLQTGEWSAWFDLGAHAGPRLHRRLNRAGGVAELPNVTAQFITEPPIAEREVEMELSTAPEPSHVVKRWRERFTGDLTSFLVSPRLAEDAAHLELASEGTARRLDWARAATGGRRLAPRQLILQTSFWAPQRPELNLKEAQVLSWLGFNVVGNMPPEVRERFPEFRSPAASHDVPLGPETARQEIRAVWNKLRAKADPGAPFHFQDEVCARPPMGTNSKALRHFHEWLASQRVDPASLGAARLEEVIPIETPEVLRERMKTNEAAARRIFYLASRFRQLAATERLLWNTEELHQRQPGVLASTLVADHPYFGGTGLGMGMEQPNTTWGGWPLALDWFDVGRRRAVDLIGIEDWLGLQFMYGPNATWEGFQLMGFQAAIFRSASRGGLPIMAWITPSDERNLRLKAGSALAQGAQHFYYWTYGPTATSTENYWSDQPGSYPGMAHLSRLLAFGEPLLAPGRLRTGRVALLYSVSSDLWQPFGYLHMLERRGLYLALVHGQWPVDFLTEEDVAEGRLKDYRVLYTADPCIAGRAAAAIAAWVRAGGTLIATGGAGSRNEWGEPTSALADVFGIGPEVNIERQKGEYRFRGSLNPLPYMDRMRLAGGAEFGVVGLQVKIKLAGGQPRGVFLRDQAPALVEHRLGRGRALYFAGTIGVSYIKEARFVPGQLAEVWPEEPRRTLAQYAASAGAAPLVQLSQPVVEAGLYDAPGGTALVLVNFTYQPIARLVVEVPTRSKVRQVRSLAQGPLPFQTVPPASPWKEAGYPQAVRFALGLHLDDLIKLE